jgi:heme/copper-type cytochrome/quinol oxidase subunit 4
MKKIISGSSATPLFACSCFILLFTLVPLALTIAVAVFDAHFFTLLLIGYLSAILLVIDLIYYFLLRPEKEERLLLSLALLACILINFPYVSYPWFGLEIDLIFSFCLLSVLLIATHAAFFAVLLKNMYRKLSSADAPH